MITLEQCIEPNPAPKSELLFLVYEGKPLPQLARILKEPCLMCFVVFPARYAPNGTRRLPIFKGFPKKLYRRMLLRVVAFQAHTFNLSETDRKTYIENLRRIYEREFSNVASGFCPSAGFSKGPTPGAYCSYAATPTKR